MKHDVSVLFLSFKCFYYFHYSRSLKFMLSLNFRSFWRENFYSFQVETDSLVTRTNDKKVGNLWEDKIVS